ncbi:DUF1285 domain-containing protein [Alteromonas oceanisediminis]|uniref:DUF1285 domain-containing protein n=1 Tax=Alteromonas oceanisediminis TaxID=2836180 RepID=UPI001BD9F153|nr:DUF1285 domain-containing protein [Alteromonas oceanisediminis]MBT0587907.1 DUF1285 domain-containing protein [Alteromonas oceanisediminis]
MDLNKLASSIDGSTGGSANLPPVEDWDPDYCGDIGLAVNRSGQWLTNDSPIGRAKLVKLFSTIIKREGDRYFLVTPVEKIALSVEDVPFIITQWQRLDDGAIQVSTQTQDSFIISEKHPVELRWDDDSSTHIPYVNVRRNLWARVHQNVFYQWAEQADTVPVNDNEAQVQMRSRDYTFSIGSVPAA